MGKIWSMAENKELKIKNEEGVVVIRSLIDTYVQCHHQTKVTPYHNRRICNSDDFSEDRFLPSIYCGQKSEEKNRWIIM